MVSSSCSDPSGNHPCPSLGFARLAHAQEGRQFAWDRSPRSASPLLNDGSLRRSHKEGWGWFRSYCGTRVLDLYRIPHDRQRVNTPYQIPGYIRSAPSLQGRSWPLTSPLL